MTPVGSDITMSDSKTGITGNMQNSASAAVDSKTKSYMYIPIRESREAVMVDATDLPPDENDILDVLKAEIAPLNLWLRFAVRVFHLLLLSFFCLPPIFSLIFSPLFFCVCFSVCFFVFVFFLSCAKIALFFFLKFFRFAFFFCIFFSLLFLLICIVLG
jgi:hypothetical protein